MDGFFAAVESLFHPEVDGKPMAVAGDPENRRGIILAKNEIAKTAGVKTAEPIWQAKHKCPELILLPPHHHLYAEYCEKANAIYQRYTDKVEQASIDESYLDITGTPKLREHGDGRKVADEIRDVIRAELKLTVSVGVSFCKIFAKMGSDLNKPNGTTVVTRETYKEILFKLPVRTLLSVGKVTEQTLADIGITTIGQLAKTSEKTLLSYLGKHGLLLYRYANGFDNEPVLCAEESEGIKSIGNGMTFKRDLVTREDVSLGLRTLSETVAYRLRKNKKKCNGVQVSIKDPELKVIDRQTQLPAPTHLAKTIYETAMKLVQRTWKAGKPIRLLTITAINLVGDEYNEQLCLFNETSEDDRQESLERTIDKLKQKYGKGIIKPAFVLKNDLGIDE